MGLSESVRPEHRLTIRSMAKRFSDNMEKFRRMWVEEERIAFLQSQKLKKHVKNQMGQAAFAMVEVDKLTLLSQIVAELSLEHEDLPGLIMPAPKPLPEPRAAKAVSTGQKQPGSAKTKEACSEGSVSSKPTVSEEPMSGKSRLDQWLKPGMHPDLFPKGGVGSLASWGRRRWA